MATVAAAQGIHNPSLHWDNFHSKRGNAKTAMAAGELCNALTADMQATAALRSALAAGDGYEGELALRALATQLSRLQRIVKKLCLDAEAKP